MYPRAGRHGGAGSTARAIATTAALVAALAAAARADTIVVDVSGGGDFPTLAAGFAAAASGDTVLIAPGTYSGEGNRDLEITSKALTIESRDGAESTVIELDWHEGIVITGAGTVPSVVRGLTFRHSGARLYDGALSCTATSITVQDCRFEENTVNGPSWSAALSVDGCSSAVVERCQFVGNTRGMSTNTSSTTILACLFEGNGEPEGGSQWADSGALSSSGEDPRPVLVDGCTFRGNWTPQEGGALEFWPGYVTVTNCTFEGNWADSNGGAVFIHYSWGATSITSRITGCTFRSNGAGEQGGAIYGVRANCEVSDCLFEDNTAAEGGAAHAWLMGAKSPKFTNCAFVGNSADMGGAVSCQDEAPKLMDCTFIGNSAELGAGVFSEDAAPIIQGCLFLENRAYIWAGGVCGTATEEGTGAQVTECTFVRNSAHRGAAIVADHAPLTVESCTFYGSTADDAVIASLGLGEIQISKSAIAFSGRGAPLTCQFGTLEASQCVIYGNASGDSLSCDHHDNLFADPRFCDVTTDNFTLCANSPCLPEGNPWGLLVGAHGAGCSSCNSAVVPASWGRIKALYR